MKGKVTIGTALFIVFTLAVVNVSAYAAGGRIISNILTFNVTARDEPKGPPSQVYVNANFDENTPGWNEDKFDNIRGAAAAVSEGGTIHIGSGTYDFTTPGYNQLVVDKDLTIAGQGKDETILSVGIHGPSSGTKGSMLVKSGALLKISNLTIDGSRYGTDYAIYVYAGQLEMTDARIRNIYANGNNGCGIKVEYTYGGNLNSISITGGTFSDIKQHAVYVYNTIVSITNSTFKGGYSPGTPADPQYAVYGIGPKNSGAINNNSFISYKGNDLSDICSVSGNVGMEGNNILNVP